MLILGALPGREESSLLSQIMASFCGKSHCLHETLDKYWTENSSRASENRLIMKKRREQTKAEIKTHDRRDHQARGPAFGMYQEAR